jgi:enterobactin synthetase component D / holo-[acyl-carrier protein] synthase
LTIESPFPPDFGFACVSAKDLHDYVPHPEEVKCLSPRAVEKRRMEFFLGRLAAFRALRELGVAPEPVLKGKHREPLWQEGIVGAISHKADTAVAVVARKNMASGVGVDLESLDRTVNFRISTKVCTEGEQAWLLEIPEEKDKRLKMLFSAKEAGFKAFFPIRQVYLGYQDAELSWNADTRRFSGVLLKGAGEDHPTGYSFEVGCRIIDRFVFSFISLPMLRDRKYDGSG